ncbi:MAG: hypothetical protein EOP49_11260 [Sphingobacteriales bacterium]|nr:MAG: hypothetical protein EOP49_11260 [Sphingobacteriales bacterium]
MKKLILLGFLALGTTSVFAGKVTTTTEIRVYGKQVNTEPIGPVIQIKCDHYFPYHICYEVRTIEVRNNKQIFQGDDIVVTVYDSNGENPQVSLTGPFDYIETTETDTGSEVAIAVQE